MSVELRLVDEPDRPAIEAQPPADPVARAEWERQARYVPPGPPYDAAERLRAVAHDVQYLLDKAAADQHLLRTWYDRHQAYEDALRKIVMAADCGRSLTKHLEAARELLPPTRYKRPPR